MRSTFAGLNTMQVHLHPPDVFDTVGNNITNLNTDGYSRQRTNIVTTPSEYILGSKGSVAIGTGCVTESIVRLRDELIDAQIRKGSTPLGYDAMEDTLGGSRIFLPNRQTPGCRWRWTTSGTPGRRWGRTRPIPEHVYWCGSAA